jgi:excisionase family DNA binding protein
LDVGRSEEATMAVQQELDVWAAELRPALLTVKQAARVLNLGRSTVYELIADGRLEVVHIGRSTRVPADCITKLIRDLRAGKTVAARS